MFEAFDYSLTYDLRTCGAANNSALVPTLSDVFTEKLTIRKELPVSVSHATTTSCFALGDPHYMTFDSMYYDFMVPGEASLWLVGCRLWLCPSSLVDVISRSDVGGEASHWFEGCRLWLYPCGPMDGIAMWVYYASLAVACRVLACRVLAVWCS